jgi:hypothetical protein
MRTNQKEPRYKDIGIKKCCAKSSKRLKNKRSGAN